MTKSSQQDPLHGLTLQVLLTRLVERYGWEELAQHIPINCFSNDPSIASSLKFLRKTPWARQKVEALYLQTQWPAEDN
ncbi:VF530 family DNA-binding protein [Methylomonas rivi]|uniref:VF530 family protein n=1 Tax=Methylomonas rivi TaxID=2952226 RepID=A0ABT1U8U8_9GAMM|nr:VF530 family protein [Methylomonas sp. WSC-6]MCQ8130284.1 VF530 family protein [Methylomonas sp. WSC-6]